MGEWTGGWMDGWKKKEEDGDCSTVISLTLPGSTHTPSEAVFCYWELPPMCWSTFFLTVFMTVQINTLKYINKPLMLEGVRSPPTTGTLFTCTQYFQFSIQYLSLLWLKSHMQGKLLLFYLPSSLHFKFNAIPKATSSPSFQPFFIACLTLDWGYKDPPSPKVLVYI